MELVKLTHENIEQEHICCAISGNKDIQVMSKKNWLKDRLNEGLAFLPSRKKMGFLSDPKYMGYKGFQTADTAEPYFELMVLPFEEGAPLRPLPPFLFSMTGSSCPMKSCRRRNLIKS